MLAGLASEGALVAEVRSLLAHADAETLGVLSAGAAAAAPAGHTAAGLAEAHEAQDAQEAHEGRQGQRLGPWRIRSLLGRGGMGDVWLATRDDGSFEGEAAIKLLRRGLDSRQVLARFALERQVLARLNHPHIARLLDAGTTEDGLPYFVMERVQGRPIHEAAVALPLEGRLALFLQLADAVMHAHRNLLVHRDLKPSNVLVDAEGRVKLLDFGIAKALDPLEDNDGLTTVGSARPFTPHYASPEQVRGEPVSTATDVYSLGVLLYQMLTGTRPTGRGATTAMEAARSVLEDEPTRPSRLSGAEATDPHWPATRLRLHGDLDNIVMKALEKPVQRRYGSVEAMADDVRAYLEGYPVRARAASPAYVARKFLARNRWAVGAAALGALGLVTGLVAAIVQGQAALALGAVGMAAGLGIALLQVRQASRARDEAQARFEDLRQLAHNVLFDYHDLVEPLAGSTPVRRRLVDDAITYLDRMVRAAPADRRVRLEMGSAYCVVGLVQRNGYRRPHLGDTEGALRNYERSIEILTPLTAANELDESAAYQLALALSARGGVLGEDGQTEAAQRDLTKAATLFERHLPRDTPDLRHRLELARTHLRLADVFKFGGRDTDALACVAQAREVLNSLAARQPEHEELPHVWVWVHNIESYMARAREDWQAVVACEERVWSIMSGLHRREPDNARFLEDLAGAAHWRMAAHGRLGEIDAVELWATEALARWRHIVRADPDDRTARRVFLNVVPMSGWAFVEAGAAPRAASWLDALQAEVQTLAQRWPDDRDTRRQRATFAVTRALAHAAASGALDATATPVAQSWAADAPAARSSAAREAHDLVAGLRASFTTDDLPCALPLSRALPALEAAEALATTEAAGGAAWRAQARLHLQRLGVR